MGVFYAPTLCAANRRRSGRRRSRWLDQPIAELSGGIPLLKIDDGPSDDGSLFVPDVPLTFYLFITHHPLPLSPSSFFKRTSFHHVTPPSPPPLLFLPLFLSPPSPLASFNLPPALSPFHPSWLPPFAFYPSFFISGYFSSPSIALCFCLH